MAVDGLAVVLALVFAPDPPASLVPVGPEFQVNTYTTSAQTQPSVAADANGNFVVVWHSLHQEGQYSVFAQRFEASGRPRGSEFRVNTYTTTNQGYARVSSDAAGNFVVVWNDKRLPDDGAIRGRRFDALGQSAGAEFVVDTLPVDWYFFDIPQAVAADAGGRFLVTWGRPDAMSLPEMAARVYDSSGTAQTAAFPVLPPGGIQFGAEVASAGLGTFVIAAVTRHAEYTHVTGGGIFDAFGMPQGNSFSRPAAMWSVRPSVGAKPDGAFVLVSARSAVSGSVDVLAQRYDPAGSPQGSELQVAAVAPPTSDVTVASQPEGEFLVAWDSYPADGSALAVVARHYDAAGNATAAEFLVNSYTTNGQAGPAVAALGNGHFVVVWRSDQQDGNSYGVFGQRFGPDVIFAAGFQE